MNRGAGPVRRERLEKSTTKEIKKLSSIFPHHQMRTTAVPEVADCFLVHPPRYHDDRGYFQEHFNEERYNFVSGCAQVTLLFFLSFSHCSSTTSPFIFNPFPLFLFYLSLYPPSSHFKGLLFSFKNERLARSSSLPSWKTRSVSEGTF